MSVGIAARALEISGFGFLMYLCFSEPFDVEACLPRSCPPHARVDHGKKGSNSWFRPMPAGPKGANKAMVCFSLGRARRYLRLGRQIGLNGILFSIPLKGFAGPT